MDDIVTIIHMNSGDGEHSYANNSSLQKTVMLKTQKVLQDTVNDYGVEDGFSECFKVADLGCSCGPNTLLFVANILEYVHSICQKKDLKAPDEFQLFLNDLPGNDFNTIFKVIPSFYLKLKNLRGEISRNCYICGVPGSFYTRLFPSQSLHFVHASYSNHFLSQVPQKLEKNNQGNIYMAKTSSLGVYEAYFDQFKRDFSTFLRMRSEEIIPNGRMVLTFLGRSIPDPFSKDCCHFLELLSESLEDILAEGLLGEEEINSFNLPVYLPCASEVKAIIQLEKSFKLDRLETFRVNWDGSGDDEDEIAESAGSGDSSGALAAAKIMRAVLEPLIASHFVSYTGFMDKLFERYEMHMTDYLSREKAYLFNIGMSLTRKTN